MAEKKKRLQNSLRNDGLGCSDPQRVGALLFITQAVLQSAVLQSVAVGAPVPKEASTTEHPPKREHEPSLQYPRLRPDVSAQLGECLTSKQPQCKKQLAASSKQLKQSKSWQKKLREFASEVRASLVQGMASSLG